jgi:hypothetical protein
MKSRDFVDKLQKNTVPDQDIFGLFLAKEDFEITVPMFNDEEVYLISDEDWRSAINMIGREMDSIYEQCYEIINEALHRVYLSKEKA